jgi:CDP-diacylglycerol--glycerol-3-phosphate 3-phosphatidyltransferase
MDIETDLMLGVFPAIAGVGIVAIALVFWTVFRSKNRPRQRAFFVEFFYWFTDPIVGLLIRLGVSPNAITSTSLVITTVAGVALANQLYFTTLFILMFGASCDVLDGQVARRTHTESRSGAFLDSFIDRLAEGAILTGAAWVGGGGFLTLIAFLAMIVSFAISYARAKGESLGVDAKVGLMQRPGRMVLILFTLAFAGGATLVTSDPEMPLHMLSGGLGLLTILSGYTVYQRVSYIMRQLDQPARKIELQSDLPTKSAA